MTPDHKPDEFTLLCKMIGCRVWREVSNPLWYEPNDEYYAAMLLRDWSIEYIEWGQSDVVYRVVRSGNVGAYRLE